MNARSPTRSNQQIAGAALDVFEIEPTPPDNPLLAFDQAIATPHLGASTAEAQLGVATMIAERPSIIAWDGVRRCQYACRERRAAWAIGPYIMLGEEIVIVLRPGVRPRPARGRNRLFGDVTGHDVKPVTQAVLSGLLSPVIERVNMVNAAIVAEERGIKVTESVSRRARDFASIIRVVGHRRARERVAGALFGRHACE